MANIIGHSLGRYHILEQLGEGGMATVYKAYDTRLETDVAVKVIRTENLAPSVLERSLKRFEREAKSLAKLNHPNIVKVIDYGEHDGKPYLVMPYLPGGTLKQKLGKPIAWRVTVRFLIPIAEALEYAHKQNVIHRDVKPANILLTETGQPMLSDFGVAKLFDMEETTNLTGTGMGVGTPEYMAPEQWLGQVTLQTDIYALGVVLYEMITGRRPYTADTPAALLLKQANDPLPRPGSFVASLPDMVEKVLLKALAKKLEDRYQDMGAFADAMAALLAGKQVSGVYSANQPIQESVTIDPQTQTRVDAVPASHTQKPNWTWIAAGLGALFFLTCLVAGGALASNWPIGWRVSPQVTQTPSGTEPQPAPANETPTFVPLSSPTLPLPTLPLPSPVPTAIPTFTLVPSPAPAFSPSNPAAFINWYFTAIWKERNYKFIWDYCQTAAFHQSSAKNDYQGFVKYYDTVQQIDVLSVDVLQHDGSTALVEVSLVYHMKAGWIDTPKPIKFKLIYNSQTGYWMFDSL